ncbi:MAG TPA: hypothetical protein VHV55_06795 [Pirellulales bacterium]|jgi:hypothetical protein|nr:hypothetical protein [Pirellulales bacterium]
MRVSRGSLLVCLGLILAVQCVSAAPPGGSKSAQQATTAKAPAKFALATFPGGTLFGNSNALGDSARIEKVLDEPTEIHFIQAPMTCAIAYLAMQYKIEIQVDDKALEEAGIDDIQLDCQVKDITLRSALRLMLRDWKLTYAIRDEVLLITTEATAETIMTTRVYPVGDLLGTGSGEVLLLNPAEDLINLITKIVAPTTWSNVGGSAMICYLPAVQCLFISQTHEVHEELADLFSIMRKLPATTAAPTGAKATGDVPDKLFVATYLLKPTAPRGAVQSGNDQNSALQAQAQAASKRALADDLARAVPKTIEPASWRGGGGQGVIESIGIGVVVRQTRRVQLQVARFLSTVGLSIAPGGDGRNVPEIHGGIF